MSGVQESDTVHVVDVRQATGGRVPRVRMNANRGEAVGYLAEPDPGRG